MPSNFRCEGTIQDFLKEQDIPGIAGIDTRALTKILQRKYNEWYDHNEMKITIWTRYFRNFMHTK